MRIESTTAHHLVLKSRNINLISVLLHIERKHMRSCSTVWECFDSSLIWK